MHFSPLAFVAPLLPEGGGAQLGPVCRIPKLVRDRGRKRPGPQ